MKKRGQPPTKYTYGIMFRGLARHAHLDGASQRAESLYKSMIERAKNLEPTVILVNGALDVCAKAGDMEAAFRIASMLPDEGPMKANAITYETILGGLYRAAQNNNQDGYNKWKSAISIGRKIWIDVIDKWIGGDLEIDARLANTMAWLLFQGAARDLDDILSLVEQTTGIPRLYAPIGNPSRKVRQDPITGSNAGRTSPYSADVEPSRSDMASAETHGSSSSEPATPETTEYEATACVPVPMPRGRTYIRPNNQLLSRVVDVCTSFSAKKEAQEYWGLMTKDLEPDLENYLSYLRLLRRCRASIEAADLVESITKPKEEGGLGMEFSHKACFIAMDCCKLSHRSSTAIRSALSILSTAKNANHHVDLATLERFGLLLTVKKDVSLQEVNKIIEALNSVFLSIKSQDSYEKEGGFRKRGRKDVGTSAPPLSSTKGNRDALAEKRGMVRITSEITKDLLQAHGRGLVPELAKQAKDMLWRQEVWLKRGGKREEEQADDSPSF